MTGSSPKQDHRGEQTAPSLRARARRLGGYAFWTSAGFFLPVAVDRLVICPLLNKHLGPEVFGAFIWVIGIMNLFGSVVANGLAILLMRDLVRQPKESAGQWVRTAMLLSGGLSSVVLIIVSLISHAAADDAVQRHALATYIPLGIYALVRSFELIVITDLRMRRRFVGVFVLRVIECVALLGNLLIVPTQNLWGIGMVYAVSVLLPLPVGMRWTREVFGSRQWWDSRAAKALLMGCFGGAGITFFEQARVYASRTVLGSLSGSAEVAILYAGTSVGNMFVMPVGVLASLVLSLLAGKKTFALPGRRGLTYALLTAGLAVAVGTASFVCGRWLVAILYPQLAPQTLPFYHWIALANGCTTVIAMMRPVAIKYAPMKLVVYLSGFTLVVQLGALAVMVPLAQARGAALSLAGSSLLAALLWLVFFHWVCRAAGRESSPAAKAVD